MNALLGSSNVDLIKSASICQVTTTVPVGRATKWTQLGPALTWMSASPSGGTVNSPSSALTLSAHSPARNAKWDSSLIRHLDSVRMWMNVPGTVLLTVIRQSVITCASTLLVHTSAPVDRDSSWPKMEGLVWTLMNVNSWRIEICSQTTLIHSV